MPFNFSRKNVSYSVILNDLPVVIKLRYPAPVLIRNFFREVAPKFEVIGRDIKRVGREGKEAKDLLLDHLEGIMQKDGTPFTNSLEDIKAELRKPQAMRFINTVINRSLFAPEIMEQEPEPERPGEEAEGGAGEVGLDFSSLFVTKPVFIETIEFDEEERQNQRVQLKFELAPWTSEQFRQYEAAKPIVQKKGRRVIMEQQENVGVINSIFEARIRSIENAVFECGDNTPDEFVEQPCSEETRSKWAGLVPYHFVTALMEEDSGSAELGND